MKSLLKVGMAICLMFSAQFVHAWGMTGHRVIAEIAENHLSKKAKKNIHKIIGNQKLAYWANWPDFIKSDTSARMQATSSWHFVNAPANMTYDAYQEVLKNTPENNLYKAYLNIKNDVKNPSGSWSEQEQLYFILHLVADAHQPMHVGREEDLGGNRIEVTFFGRKTNIHRVWDSDLVENEQYAYTEYARVLDIDKNAYKRHTQNSWEDWLYDTHQVANKIYADVAKNKELSYTYIFDYKYIMEECLLKAGLRLAKELNEIYG